MQCEVHVIAAPLTLSAPASWDVNSYRACELCKHLTRDDGDLVCRCPAAIAPDRLRPVTVARARHGGCGPDALHMRADFDSLHA
jgi:hypothetical protein